MMGQKKLEIFLVKIRKSLAKQFLEVAYIHNTTLINKPYLEYINKGVKQPTVVHCLLSDKTPSRNYLSFIDTYI